MKISVISKGGREAVVAMLGPGEFFGEGGLAGQAVRLGTASAMTDSAILVVDKDQMADQLHQESALADRFIAQMLVRGQISRSYPVRLGGSALALRFSRR